VPATFFLTGDFVRTHSDTMAEVAASHYLVGNHTMTHPHLSQLSPAAVTEEIRDADQQLRTVLGHSARPWFRFPFGEYDGRTLRVVHDLGYGAIGWTVDTRGWMGRGGGTPADIVSRVHEALQPGAIVLMHLGANPDDGTTFDADALPDVISAIRAAGYRLVALTNW